MSGNNPVTRGALRKGTFSGPLAATGVTLPAWKCVKCPRCQVLPGASCGRWIIEKIDGVETGRRWARLKNPHRERQSSARNAR